MVAACSHESWSGFGTTSEADTTISSAYAPSMRYAITSSPAMIVPAGPAASGPTAVTTPAASNPKAQGKCGRFLTTQSCIRRVCVDLVVSMVDTDRAKSNRNLTLLGGSRLGVDSFEHIGVSKLSCNNLHGPREDDSGKSWKKASSRKQANLGSPPRAYSCGSLTGEPRPGDQRLDLTAS